jgi:hypothetical protein
LTHPTTAIDAMTVKSPSRSFSRCRSLLICNRQTALEDRSYRELYWA